MLRLLVPLASSIPVWNLDDPVTLASMLLCLLIPVVLDIPGYFLFRRWPIRISVLISEICLFLGYLFGIDPLFYLALAALIVTLCYALMASSFVGLNASAMNPFKNLFGAKSRRESKRQGEALFDREEVYGRVRDAVLAMSKKKVGAIITFERKVSLADQMKTGTMVNAPISSELLQTIFYPGTRLHDGAVIIRNDMIVAAAVFYTPTTRPLSGKYGSRHRAAIGISEVSDSVTVIVSEETGRISIAYQGELNSVLPDQFFDTLMEYLSMVNGDASFR